MKRIKGEKKGKVRDRRKKGIKEEELIFLDGRKAGISNRRYISRRGLDFRGEPPPEPVFFTLGAPLRDARWKFSKQWRVSRDEPDKYVRKDALNRDYVKRRSARLRIALGQRLTEGKRRLVISKYVWKTSPETLSNNTKFIPTNRTIN